MYRYQQLSSSASASSATGRPPGIMGFLHKKCCKTNKSHYSAFCDACTLAGLDVKVLGMSDSMKSHLQKCDSLPEAVYSWAKDWTKDSELFVGEAADAADSGELYVIHTCLGMA